MNKPSKCKNCQWYGKPYWSIINPCDNCPNENIETFTHWVDPTIEEKNKEIKRLNKEIKTLLKENDNKEKVIIKQNNIMDELEEDLEKNYIRWKKYAKTHKEDAWRMIICKYYLDKLKELKDK